MAESRALFDEDHEAFRSSFREFLDRDVLPTASQWRSAGMSPSAVFAVAGENGFLGMAVPDRYGGGGVDDPRFSVAAAEELMRAGLTGLALAFATHINVALPLVTVHANAEQQERWLPGLASGESLAAVAGALEPVPCVPDSGGLRIEGMVPAVVNAAAAGDFVVVTRAATGECRIVVVDAGAEGMRRAAASEPPGLYGAGVADLHLDSVAVADRDILPGDGDELRRSLQIDEQLALAAISVAGGRTALSGTLEYVRDRTVFGRSVATFQNTRYAVAEVQAEISLAEAYRDLCVRKRMEGQLDVLEAATAKLRCTELFGHAVDQGLQLHGGYGYMLEYPIAQAFADARYLRLHGGTSEAMKETLAVGLGL